MGSEISKVQAKKADNDNYLRSKRVQAGNENSRENESLEDCLTSFAKARLDKNELDNGPNKDKTRPKTRKQKLQARNSKTFPLSANGPMCTKKPNSELVWPSPENKKKRSFNPLNQLNSGCFSNPSRAKTQLKFVDAKYDAGMELEEMVDDKSVGAGGQPRWQL